MSESLQEWLALLVVGITVLLIMWRWIKARINQNPSTGKGCNNCGSNASCSTGSSNELSSTQNEHVIPIRVVKHHGE